MQANKGTGTKPELLLAKAIFARGYRYRKNNKTVYGKPDITFKNIRQICEKYRIIDMQYKR